MTFDLTKWETRHNTWEVRSCYICGNSFQVRGTSRKINCSHECTIIDSGSQELTSIQKEKKRATDNERSKTAEYKAKKKNTHQNQGNKRILSKARSKRKGKRIQPKAGCKTAPKRIQPKAGNKRTPERTQPKAGKNYST